MGFFDRLFKGKEVFADRRNPDMVCEMTLCGQAHILSEFDFDPKETRREFETEFKFFPEWLANLDYLRNCMIDLRMKGYNMPPMPALRTYDEYSSYCEKRSHQDLHAGINMYMSQMPCGLMYLNQNL